MKYSTQYEIRARRAIGTGIVDFEAFVEALLDDGVPPEAINQMLIEDLENEGQIFGKFFRSLEYAGDLSINVAESQASNVTEIIELDSELGRVSRETIVDGQTLEQLVEQGDPEALEVIEDAAENQPMTWICTLRKTCDQCLPLHSKTMTRAEWAERGLRPRAIHPRCECDWVPAELARDRDDLIDPLVRNKVGEEKGGLRTIRGVANRDIDRARAAVEKAMQSKEGRRMMRRLGESAGE